VSEFVEDTNNTKMKGKYQKQRYKFIPTSVGKFLETDLICYFRFKVSKPIYQLKLLFEGD